MSQIRIQSKETLEAAANELVTELVKENTLKAEQTEKINAVKKRHKIDIDPVKRGIASLRGKISRYLGKSPMSIFDGKETGTIKTNMATVSLSNNPPAVVQIDKSAEEEALVAHAKSLGVFEVIQTKEVLNKDALALLKEAELERIGFMRVQDKTLTIRLNANPELKTSQRIKS